MFEIIILAPIENRDDHDDDDDRLDNNCQIMGWRNPAKTCYHDDDHYDDLDSIQLNSVSSSLNPIEPSRPMYYIHPMVHKLPFNY